MEIKLINVRSLPIIIGIRKRLLLMIMRTFIFLLCTTVFSFNVETTLAQEKVTIEVDKEATIDEVFEIIIDQTKYRFLYPVDLFKDTPKVQLKKGTISVDKLLNQSISTAKFNIVLSADNTIVIKEKHTQQKSVSGTVTDEKGTPLLGATILIKGTNRGTTADIDGKFQIVMPENENTLVFSFIGYKTQQVEVDTSTTLNIIMQSEESLREVVVIGYGTAKKEDIIGSVGIVSVEHIQMQAPTVNIDYALQGLIPGVQITGSNGQPGAPARIRIRGTTSLMGSNQPLYVIDGIPVVAESNIPSGGSEGSNLANALEQQGLNTPIGNLNSNDIASITVLKDASAGAIYGSRAANGVIIITTKRGKFSDKPRFNFDYSLSTQEPRTLDVLNAEQFRNVTTTAVENGTINNAYTRSVLDGSYFGNSDTNWEEELSPSNPITQNFYLSLQGGNETTRYLTALGVKTEEGVFENTSFDRYTFKLNLDSQISSKWKFGVNTHFSFSDQNALDGSVTDRMYIFRPDLPVFDDNGNYSFSTGYSLENPVALSQATNENKTFLLLGSLFTELEIFEGLVAKTLLSMNYNNGLQNSFYPKFTFRGGWSTSNGDGDGYAQESRSNFTNIMWENTLRYNKLIGDLHNVDAVIGASFEQSKNSFVKAWGTGYFNDVLTNISSATVSKDGASLETGSGLASYFGRFNYDFDTRYLLSFSARIDGSSKFAVENKYAFFPAMAVGWRISEEAFLEDKEAIDEIKLRASWGITGQQDFGPYQWRTLYETDDYGGAPSIVLSQLGNDRLKWERSKQFDLGMNFSFFKSRLNGEMGYYVKDTEDAIFTAISPGNTGFSSVVANVGNTRNTGFEFQFGGDIISNENFKWNLSINATTNTNKLVRISDDFKDEDGFITGFGGGGILREGSPIGLIYGYVSEGIFQSQSEIDALNTSAPNGIYQNAATSPGDIRFRDINGPLGVPDGVITNLDQEIIGDTQPDFFGGLTNRFDYKGFSLTALFTYSVGNDLHWFNQARSINFASSFLAENKTTEVLNAWTPENQSNIPRVVFGDPNDNDRISSHYVYDASFVRLKTLNLQYSFPRSVLEGFGFLDSASIYLVGQNLLTFTDYPGADPEATNLYNNDISAGRDNNRFPPAKVFTVGIKIGF